MLSIIRQLIIKTLLIKDQPFYKGASILMYHSIGESPSSLSIESKMFEKQLRYLKEKKFPIIFLSELIDRLSLGRPISECVAITFDDGYEDFYYNALPLIQQYQIPVTMFLPLGLLGQKMLTSGGYQFPVMSKAMIEDIKLRFGGLVEFMPHTHSHSDLSKLKPELYDQEIGQGSPGQSILAYPKGRYQADIISYLKANYWQAALTVNPGLVTAKDRLFELPRNAVAKETTFSHFRLLVSNRLPLFLFIKPFLRFVVSGGISAITNISLLFIFTEFLGIWYLISGAVSFFLSVLVGFFLQKIWTFKDRTKHRVKRQFVLFLIVAILNLFINTLLLYTLTDLVGIYYIFSQIIASTIIAGGSFLSYQKFVFNKNN